MMYVTGLIFEVTSAAEWLLLNLIFWIFLNMLLLLQIENDLQKLVFYFAANCAYNLKSLILLYILNHIDIFQ